MSTTLSGQSRHWSRHASQYDDVFLDPFISGVENPMLAALEAVADPGSKTVADLGCGTGPLLPILVGRYAEVFALDFASGMIARSRERLGPDASRVTFLKRRMDELNDYQGRFDVVVAVNSLVMPDVRDIDRTLSAIHASLRPDGQFLGVVPAMDALYYQTLLLVDRALAEGHSPKEAERLAAHQAEHSLYDFTFGRFSFQGLHQKFWQAIEIEYRLRRAGFAEIRIDKLLYPWDDNLPGGSNFTAYPRSWDWTFSARP
ncbi:hypothetical protein BH23PLA1_BH23PLA1_09440 [soil metagenome]